MNLVRQVISVAMVMVSLLVATATAQVGKGVADFRRK